MSDLQARYWLEARECLNLVRQQCPDQPEFWANLLGAVANASMASAPQAIVDEAEAILNTPPPSVQKRARSRVKRDLKQ